MTETDRPANGATVSAGGVRPANGVRRVFSHCGHWVPAERVRIERSSGSNRLVGDFLADAG